MSYTPLSRSEINKLSGEAQVAFCLDKQPTYEVALARAIEAAATAPLLARIAKLEAELAEASKNNDALLEALKGYVTAISTAGGGDKALFMAAIREADHAARAAIDAMKGMK